MKSPAKGIIAMNAQKSRAGIYGGCRFQARVGLILYITTRKELGSEV